MGPKFIQGGKGISDIRFIHLDLSDITGSKKSHFGNITHFWDHYAIQQQYENSN